jgi:hypothetical protein
MAEPMIAKRGRLVVETDKGVKPATRKDLDGANLVGARGPIFVETPQGLEPATIGDARSAVGRVAEKQRKNVVSPFATGQVDPSKAAKKARASETPAKRRQRAVKAGRASAAALTAEQRRERAQKGWATRRRNNG